MNNACGFSSLVYLCSDSYKNVQLATYASRSSTQAMERGLELTRKTSMSLTYRGKTYQQNKTAIAKKHAVLTYRGNQYQS